MANKISLNTSLIKTISDFYYPGIPYQEFLKEVFTTRYPIQLRVPDFMKDYIMLMQPDITGWGSKEGSREERKLYKKSQPRFQFWTKEYLDGLANYLNKKYPNKLVLEVGCGNGELTLELEKRGVRIIATDDYSWGRGTKERLGGVKYADWILKLDHKKALAQFKDATVVISSWMPYKDDWTPEFRKYLNIKEYILIGEGQGGCCGAEESFIEFPGWKEVEADFSFDKYNICRTDSLDISLLDPKKYKGYSMTMLHSRTTAFERVRNTTPFERLSFNLSIYAKNAWENSWRVRSRINDLWGLKTHLRELRLKRKANTDPEAKKALESLLRWKEIDRLGDKLSFSYKDKNESLWIKLKKFFQTRGY